MSKLTPTPQALFEQRRHFLAKAMKLGLLCASPLSLSALATPEIGADLSSVITPEKNATRYNNFFEFTTNKKHVHIIAKDFNPSPWSIEISGEVSKPLRLSMDQLPPSHERILRFRCVEGWSMVVPWQGFSLNELLTLAQPNENARFVRFTSVHRPSEMIGQRTQSLAWPYEEGLRLDEAMHPLTTLATGMYDKPLPNQNGAPIRLIVPWKYGFKSIKSITKIEVTKEKPATSWNQLAPEEYGFYANVNPNVAHPRWSQRREVPLGQLKKVRTLPFNGYESEVAHLYANMDLSTFI